MLSGVYISYKGFLPFAIWITFSDGITLNHVKSFGAPLTLMPTLRCINVFYLLTCLLNVDKRAESVARACTYIRISWAVACKFQLTPVLIHAPLSTLECANHGPIRQEHTRFFACHSLELKFVTSHITSDSDAWIVFLGAHRVNRVNNRLCTLRVCVFEVC